MDDEQFVLRISDKIERLTGRRVDLRIDHEDASKLEVELDHEVPVVMVGTDIFHYPGFARMCIEYATASIQQQRTINVLEFQLLLARN